jgi:hypothetical protein
MLLSKIIVPVEGGEFDESDLAIYELGEAGEKQAYNFYQKCVGFGAKNVYLIRINLNEDYGYAVVLRLSTILPGKYEMVTYLEQFEDLPF